MGCGSTKHIAYIEDNNFIYLKLLSCLLRKLHFCVKLVQTEELSGCDIMKALKEALVRLGGLTIQFPNYLETELTHKTQKERFIFIYGIDFTEEDVYRPQILNKQMFREKLILEHTYFKNELSKTDEKVQENCFQVAPGFVVASLGKINTDYLPATKLYLA